MYRKKHSIHRVPYYLQFQAYTGGLGMYSLWISGDDCRKLSGQIWYSVGQGFRCEETLIRWDSLIVPSPGAGQGPMLKTGLSWEYAGIDKLKSAELTLSSSQAPCLMVLRENSVIQQLFLATLLVTGL